MSITIGVNINYFVFHISENFKIITIQVTLYNKEIKHKMYVHIVSMLQFYLRNDL